MANAIISNNDYLNQLNEVQRQAVTNIDGPVLVVAGPGSGKTRVLTFRIAHLIQSGIAPYHILALTFTNKAAREMKERIAKVVGDKANQVWAGTFHSLFSRILRIEAEKIGYPSNFTIYDTEDSKKLITNIIKELNLDTNTYNTNAIRARISSAKSNLITPKLYEANEALREEDRMAKRPYIYTIYEKYTGRCKKAGAMDFDDLLYRLYELLQKNPDGILEKYRKRFSYILVDEFQDTNQLQYAIVRKLVNYENSKRNVCVVGDDAQSIYAFRGATIQNILDFEEEYKPHGIKVFKLEQNYRSTDHIVKAANEIITNNRRQIPKTIWSHKGEGNRIKVIKAVNDTEEGKRVADTIVEQKNRHHLSNKDIAILYRTNSQSRVFEEFLRRQNILYKIFGGLSFYQRKEVKDLVAYLRLAVNVNDEEAFRRVINFPKRGIGNTTLDKITQVANSKDKTLWESLPLVKVSARTKTSLRAFFEMINDFRKRAESEESNAYETARYIAEKSGLFSHYKADNSVEGAGRTDNIIALLDGAQSFVQEDSPIDTENLPDKKLASYLQNIALLTDLDDEEKSGGDYVSLMSVHAAKGLEFKSVFVVGLEEKLFPSFMSMNTMEEIDEERRLFYVAITRAEELLTLSYANSRYRFGQTVNNDPSRFLDELPITSIERIMSTRTQMSTRGEPVRSAVKGVFKQQQRQPKVDPATFKPSPSGSIEVGMQVLHLRFGEGKVLKIDGGEKNRIATIQFNDLEDAERRIMLKFAKLQILE